MPLDFFIAEQYRGRTLDVVLGDDVVQLAIPSDACYLDVRPLEDEEEYGGDQTISVRQMLCFYDAAEGYLSLIDWDGVAQTSTIMNAFDSCFTPQYRR
jgi:hypothetical protein